MTPFTLHFTPSRNGKMSGEIKFKGHPCLTFTGKSWQSKDFYVNLVAILNISQHEQEVDSSLVGDTDPVHSDLDDNN